jgi:hypothetical protein
VGRKLGANEKYFLYHSIFITSTGFVRPAFQAEKLPDTITKKKEIDPTNAKGK